MTEPEPLQQVERTFVRFGNRKLSYFAGCDYFRLASHPKVVAALHEGVDKYGLNVAASRLTTGNHALYHDLERQLAEFFNAETATLVSGGYITNLVVAQAVAGNFSHALIDEKAHPSLHDAARFLECPIIAFKHLDANDLAASVRRLGPAAKLVLLTDGMFSNDGSTAPLQDYLRVLPADGMIFVDDAHGAGVLGETGKGSLEHEGVSRRRIIQTITLSKAFGAYGGAVLGRSQLRARIFDRSRIFKASTPLPLPIANAVSQSVRLLKTDRSLRKRLARNVNYVRTRLRKAGVPAPETPGPILTVLPGSKREVPQLRRKLLAARIYPPFIKYPNGPENGYFRFMISSEHTRAQLDQLSDTLSRLRPN